MHEGEGRGKSQSGSLMSHSISSLPRIGPFQPFVTFPNHLFVECMNDVEFIEPFEAYLVFASYPFL